MFYGIYYILQYIQYAPSKYAHSLDMQRCLVINGIPNVVSQIQFKKKYQGSDTDTERGTMCLAYREYRKQFIAEHLISVNVELQAETRYNVPIFASVPIGVYLLRESLPPKYWYLFNTPPG